MPLHPICHQAIHANFSNVDLARNGGTADVLRQNPNIAKFLKWIEGKPADFHARTESRRK